MGGNTAWQGVEAPPRVCNLLIANTWASPLPPRMPDEGCVHPTPGVLVFVKEAWVSYTRVRGQLLQVGNNSICLRFVFLHFLQHSWGGPLKSLSLSPPPPSNPHPRQCVCDYRLLNCAVLHRGGLLHCACAFFTGFRPRTALSLATLWTLNLQERGRCFHL